MSTIDSRANKKYELSALLHADSFHYGLFDYGDLLVDAGSFAMDKLEAWTTTNKLRKVKLSILNKRFVLVPNAELSAEPDLRAYLEGLNLVSDQDAIAHDYMHEQGLTIVYAKSARATQVINNHLEVDVLRHFTSVFIEAESQRRISDYVSCVFVGQQVLIGAWKGGQIRLVELYDFYSATAALYYISLIYEKLDLSQVKTPLNIMGGIMPTGEIMTLLKKFYADISLEQLQIKQAQPIAQYPSQLLYPLDLIHQCV